MNMRRIYENLHLDYSAQRLFYLNVSAFCTRTQKTIRRFIFERFIQFMCHYKFDDVFFILSSFLMLLNCFRLIHFSKSALSKIDNNDFIFRVFIVRSYQDIA